MNLWTLLILDLLLGIHLAVYLYQRRADKDLTRSKIFILLFSLALPLGVQWGIRNIPTGFLFTLIPFLGTMVYLTMDLETALILSVVGSIAVAFMGQPTLEGMVYHLLAGWTAVFTASFFRDRYSIYRVVLAVFFICALLGMILWPEIGLGEVFQKAFLSSLLSGFLVLGILPLYERFFGVATDLLLLELLNPNHPLLREFAEKAPGSFAHSQNIANLAEAAARALGVNPLLARVAAYYHDIGKMAMPEYFVENQMASENPHDGLAPVESAKVLLRHVQEGLKIAKRYSLPKEILGVIETHHGTTLMEYFYAKAAQATGSAEESEFRYVGPKPRNKLEAILMLADSVEAATRTLDNPDAHEIRTMVRSIIEKKLQDGQLDQTDLTRRDLQKIEEAFTQALKGVHHSRIEYPKENNKNHGDS